MLSQSGLITVGNSATADGSVGKPDGSYSLFRTSSLNCNILESDVGELIVKYFAFFHNSDPRLLELSGFECRSGEEFGVVKFTTFTVGFSVWIVISSKDEMGRAVDK